MFDASTAKIGSEWKSRDGNKLTFVAWVPNAQPSDQALFINGAGEVLKRNANGFFGLSSGKSFADITGPWEAQSKHYQVSTFWVAIGIHNAVDMKIHCFNRDREALIKTVKEKAAKDITDSTFFIVKVPGFSMFTNQKVVEISDMKPPFHKVDISGVTETEQACRDVLVEMARSFGQSMDAVIDREAILGRIYKLTLEFGQTCKNIQAAREAGDYSKRRKAELRSAEILKTIRGLLDRHLA